MAEDKSRYYTIKLFDPTGAEVSKKVYRLYPEDEHGKKLADMQGAKLGLELAGDALDHARDPSRFQELKDQQAKRRAELLAGCERSSSLTALFSSFYKKTA